VKEPTNYQARSRYSGPIGGLGQSQTIRLISDYLLTLAS